jgi:hypothetical protein
MRRSVAKFILHAKHQSLRWDYRFAECGEEFRREETKGGVMPPNVPKLPDHPHVHRSNERSLGWKDGCQLVAAAGLNAVNPEANSHRPRAPDGPSKEADHENGP